MSQNYKGIKRNGSEPNDNYTRDIPLPHSAPATIPTEDDQDLAGFDFASRGNRRYPDIQLYRRAAGPDQSIEGGS